MSKIETSTKVREMTPEQKQAYEDRLATLRREHVGSVLKHHALHMTGTTRIATPKGLFHSDHYPFHRDNKREWGHLGNISFDLGMKGWDKDHENSKPGEYHFKHPIHGSLVLHSDPYHILTNPERIAHATHEHSVTEV